jgi:hypothetical protein
MSHPCATASFGAKAWRRGGEKRRLDPAVNIQVRAFLFAVVGGFEFGDIEFDHFH